MLMSALKLLLIPSSSAIPMIGNNLFIGLVPSTYARPYVCIHPISRTEMNEANIATERVQINCYADYMSSATQLAESILTTLKLYKGIPSTLVTIDIINTFYDNMSYVYDNDIKTHVQMLDMIIKYKR